MEPANAEEVVLIQQFRKRIEDLQLCDEAISNPSLVRWLRARNLKVEDAEEMLRKHLRWYEEQNLSEIFSYEPPKEFESHRFRLLTWSGFDYKGCPILIYDSLDYINLVSMIQAGFKKEYMRVQLQSFEQNCNMLRAQKEKKGVDYLFQYTAIMDLEHMHWRQITCMELLNAYLVIGRWIEENYPETCNAVVLVNAPRVFYYTWTLLQSIVSARTASKFQVFGFDKKEWKRALLKIAAEDQLPKKFGGILPDGTNIGLDVKDCVVRERGSY